MYSGGMCSATRATRGGRGRQGCTSPSASAAADRGCVLHRQGRAAIHGVPSPVRGERIRPRRATIGGLAADRRPEACPRVARTASARGQFATGSVTSSRPSIARAYTRRGVSLPNSLSSMTPMCFGGQRSRLRSASDGGCLDFRTAKVGGAGFALPSETVTRETPRPIAGITKLARKIVAVFLASPRRPDRASSSRGRPRQPSPARMRILRSEAARIVGRPRRRAAARGRESRSRASRS